MSLLSHIDFIVMAQFGTVIFGTILAAPLLSSLETKRRRAGFICMMLGSFSALIATAMSGLWVLVAANAFWIVSSMRGFWQLQRAMRHEAGQTACLLKAGAPKEILPSLQLVVPQQNNVMPEPGALVDAVSQTLLPSQQDMVR